MSPESEDVDESYQVDAVVSLFAIMLIVLLTLVVATATATNVTVTEYRIAEEKTEDVKLRSLFIPYRVRQYWTLTSDGELLRVDTAERIGRLPEASRGAALSETIDGVDIEFEADPVSPGGFVLRFDIFDRAAGDWAVADALSVNDAAALAAWAAVDAGTVLFVANDARDWLPVVSEAASGGARTVRFRIPREGSRYFSIVRSRSAFRMENIYRAR